MGTYDDFVRGKQLEKFINKRMKICDQDGSTEIITLDNWVVGEFTSLNKKVYDGPVLRDITSGRWITLEYAESNVVPPSELDPRIQLLLLMLFK